MSARFITGLYDLEKTIDRLSAYSREEAGYPTQLHGIVTTMATALEQIRQLLCTLGQDLAEVDRMARRADRREFPQLHGGSR